MKHQEALDNKKFDRRLVNWNLKRGIISEAEVKAHLENVEDCSTNARTVEIEMDDDSLNDGLN